MSQQQPQPQPQQSEQSQEGMDIQMRETFGSGRKCLHEFLKGRAVLKQKYQHYDSAIMDQRKNRPKLKLMISICYVHWALAPLVEFTWHNQDTMGDITPSRS